jgi:diaminohydroxyphosphoribosylaminopyrimidine deaminase / 5-amino-6-(5-phosphoribosylamino)uracil reductase
MIDNNYMRHALELAKNGKGLVSPNPLVGCVIVKEDKIIGEGWHKAYGKPHAEIEAMKGVNSELLNGATLYVNLEPCSHFGKTPPCTDAIIENKIKRVVVGMQDPNPLVCGMGITKMRDAGIEVLTNVLESEFRYLNRYFVKYITKGLPYIVLKTAMSLDGFTAAADGNSKWLTSEDSRREVHKLRSEIDAVLVGKNTVLADNPLLNVRLVEGRSPVRVILDSNLEIPEDANIYNTSDKQKTIVCYSANQANKQKSQLLNSIGVTLLPVGKYSFGKLDLVEIMQKLAQEQNISSLLVEGGAEVHSSFLEKEFYDELHVFQAPIILGAGKKVFGAYSSGTLQKGLTLSHISSKNINNDCYIIYQKDKNE